MAEENPTPPPKQEKGVIGAEITEEMEKAYIDYAMSVIVSRALPSVEDGLKPVHRRILYAMNLMNLKPTSQTRKCARIVGDTIGKLHPHGDVAVYDALVRMAQDFSLRYPLVIGQGNFGCFTADTKVKLTDGRNLSFKELIEENKRGKRNFTFTIDNGEIKIAEIKNPRLTKKNTEIMRIILDNEEEIKCTPNHKFMLREGDYKKAKDLQSGDSLMPVYLRLSIEKDYSNPKLTGYPMIYQPKTKEWNGCHILADNWNLENGIYQKTAGRIRHHVDFNKLNNNPDNVRRMKWREHWQTHYNFISEKHKIDPEYRKKLSEGRNRFWNDKKNREAYSKRMTERNLRNWKKEDYRQQMRITLSEINKRYLKKHPERIEEIRKTASITMKKLWGIPKYKQLFHEKIVAADKKRETNLTGKKKFLRICDYLININLELNKENYEKVRKEIFGAKSFTSWDLGIKKYFNNDLNLILCEINGNHKVVRAEFLNEFTDVYDLTIDKTHNFALASGILVHNSIDGDMPAAYRYTEAKLSEIALELLEDLDKETIKFMPNFDGSLKEPEVLPGKLPNLLINGSSGIAVGLATNIPPHNLTEVCDGIIKFIENPEIAIEKLINIIPAPDFPTGGYVSGDLEEIYKIGRGRLIIRGKTTTEEKKSKTYIIITEIPYQLNKADLITQIAKLVQENKLSEINDVRDESAKGKIRIVIELKRGADPKFCINRLYKYTRLQDSFDVNLVGLVKNKPQILNLKKIISVYVNHRKAVVEKRTKFLLNKSKERLEIVLGLLIALKDIDSVIDLIKKAANATEAKDSLVKKYKLSIKQAEAILEIKLSALTRLEQDKLKKEESDLKENIKQLEKILSSEQEILQIIRKELLEIRRKYGDNRRTQILQKIQELEEKDLIKKRQVVISITEKGYVKRQGLKVYKEQKRGGKGVIGSDLATGDFVKQLITCSTHDYLLFFTSKGRVYWLKAYQIPEMRRYGKGKALINLLKLKDEKVASILNVKKFSNFLIFVTKQGQVKKLSLQQLAKPRKTGVRVMKLPQEDVLIDVKPISSGQEVMLITSKGLAIRFNSKEVRQMGKSAYGVTGIKLNAGDSVVSLEIPEKQTILTITEKGYGKRSKVKDYRLTGRAGKGVINLKVTEKTGKVISTVPIEDKDSVIVTTAKGMVIRTSMKQIRVMSRATQGVRIVKLQIGDRVSDIVKVPEAEFGEVDEN